MDDEKKTEIAKELFWILDDKVGDAFYKFEDVFYREGLMDLKSNDVKDIVRKIYYDIDDAWLDYSEEN